MSLYHAVYDLTASAASDITDIPLVPDMCNVLMILVQGARSIETCSIIDGHPTYVPPILYHAYDLTA